MTAADWNNIWGMLQELGAAIAPLEEGRDAPDWVVSLRKAMDEAEPAVVEMCDVIAMADGAPIA